MAIAARTESALATAAAELDATGTWTRAGQARRHDGPRRGPAPGRRRARSELGPISVAVSNVIGHVIDSAEEGEGPGAGTFASMPAGEYQREFRQLFVSAWALATACLPDMRAARWGRIVNIGSGVAREPATELPHVLPNVVRPAVAGMHRILAARLAGEGVTVNNILTGSILTERNLSYWNWLASETGRTFDEVTEQFHARHPAAAPGPARGDGGARGVPVLRAGRPHHRSVDPGRRRHQPPSLTWGFDSQPEVSTFFGRFGVRCGVGSSEECASSTVRL